MLLYEDKEGLVNSLQMKMYTIFVKLCNNKNKLLTKNLFHRFTPSIMDIGTV